MSTKTAALNFAREHGFTGDQLPRGHRKSAGSCPLARAIGGGCLISGGFLLPDGSDEEQVLPALVRRFVKEFDDGRYPELIDDPPIH